MDYLQNLKLPKLPNINISVPNIKGLSKNPTKYLFYMMTIVLPVLSCFLLQDLKIFSILLVSYSTFLVYLNICLFENLCILPENKKNCKIKMIDIRESVIMGFSAFLLLWLCRSIFKLF